MGKKQPEHNENMYSPFFTKKVFYFQQNSEATHHFEIRTQSYKKRKPPTRNANS